MNWQTHLTHFRALLERLEVTDAAGRPIELDAAFEQLARCSRELRDRGNTIYCIGNGASASMASHFAADMAKNGRLHTEVFTDLALLSAVSNDMGFEHVYSEPLRRRARPGDLLLAISSSGASPNILRRVDVARNAGLTVVTLSAMKPDNPLRRTGGCNFYFPADEYGDAESLHAVLLHYWIDLLLKN